MLSKVVSTVMILTSLLGSSHNYDMAFKYDSLMVGLHKPAGYSLSDSEWRDYYTGRFSEKFSDIHISSRAYDWYRSQKNTNDDMHNCGAAGISMALKWYNEASDISVNTIRNYFGHFDSGINTSEIKYYLDISGVTNTSAETNLSEIQNVVSHGGIVIALLKTPESYHCEVINGYYKFDDKLYITYFDPEGNDKSYDLSEIDYAYYMQNYHYSIISGDDLEKQLYRNWSLEILPNNKAEKQAISN